MKVALVCIGLISWAHVFAQEFWMQPATFNYKSGQTIKIDFVEGENFTGQYAGNKPGKIKIARLLYGSKEEDLSAQVKVALSGNLNFTFSQPGTYTFGVEKNPEVNEWQVNQFLTFLEENGEETILQQLKRNSLNITSLQNQTICFTKLIVQNEQFIDATFNKTFQYALEIVAQSNPYQLKSGDYLSCLVLFQGKPCAHHLVKVWSSIGRTAFLQNLFTEKDGAVKFPISTKGKWMVSAVYVNPSTDKNFNYRILKSSLVFGIE